jgi:hypothetical protein
MQFYGVFVLKSRHFLHLGLKPDHHEDEALGQADAFLIGPGRLLKHVARVEIDAHPLVAEAEIRADDEIG